MQFYHPAQPQMLLGLWEHQIVMLTAGMSTRAVCQKVPFRHHKLSPKAFQKYDITSSRPHRPRLTTPDQDLHMQHLHVRDHHHQPPGGPLQQTVCRTKEILHKWPKNTSGKLVCSSVWLPFVVVADMSGQTLTFDFVWCCGEVLSS